MTDKVKVNGRITEMYVTDTILNSFLERGLEATASWIEGYVASLPEDQREGAVDFYRMCARTPEVLAASMKKGPR